MKLYVFNSCPIFAARSCSFMWIFFDASEERCGKPSSNIIIFILFIHNHVGILAPKWSKLEVLGFSEGEAKTNGRDLRTSLKKHKADGWDQLKRTVPRPSD